MNESIIFDFLKNHKLQYQLFEHQPVFTCAEIPVITAIDGVATSGSVPGPEFKTLFLKDNKNKFFLVSVLEDKRVDLKALSDILKCGRFSFGKAEELLELLRLTPGSVTPFGLIFDTANTITYVLDEDALQNDYVSFHPLRNDMTIVMHPQTFLTCMEKLRHAPQIIQIPIK
jgi:Ala-tRNA(Pro) deacylase